MAISRPCIVLHLLFALFLAAAAHELLPEAVVSTYTTDLRAGGQVVAAGTCPPGAEVLSGGYKLLASSVTMRALVVVENRPVPEAREWSVTLLYDPAPHERQQGRMTLETSALCHHAHGDARLRMGQREL